MTPAAEGAGERSPVVAIVGGGYTGAVAAWNLARGLPPGSARILVVEPRAEIGRGLAYSTLDPSHRINVPAARMSLSTEDPGDFFAWVKSDGIVAEDPEAQVPTGEVFPRRQVFGSYIAARLAPALASGAVEHLRGSVRRISPEGEGWRLELADGREIAADLVALAASHPRPAVPGPLRALAASPKLVADPYDLSWLAELDPQERVLIVGSGLTSADLVASLDARGHKGEILVVSRRGFRSRGHAFGAGAAPFDRLEFDTTSASALLRSVRRHVREAVAAGHLWQHVLDVVRTQGGEIWRGLSPEARRRVVRHLRVVWDAHRFRIAPQPEAVIARREAEGSLRHEAAALTGSALGEDGRLTVSLRPRGRKEIRRESFDRVLVTTGPAHDRIGESNPALGSLIEAGLIGLDGNGLGLSTTPEGAALRADGALQPGLYVAGPLARGAAGELMGLPEVTRHAEGVARLLEARLREEKAAALQ
ncbi:FAD/NAD(P)-binding protein [Neomegalonema sp.]|uniref:FAD/NAD(P)-binding protein n=1 Tax=Neomegalonema sp. TaxID=2039713 RepID=UPI002610FF9E|nr:FAD/NAD(P)-binding protein [Neomegalonema sp.]MDD2869332.1 FAD/NAD(P)-binding protein [Neomegalonema sp.]